MHATFEKQTGGYTKATTPTTVKGCKSFAGMVNFLSMFCPELQKLLKPIYNLTRKGRPFVWGKEQQDFFEEIKCKLIKPPVLHMPNKTGRFHLYSDTSKFAMGSELHQIQNGKPKLIAYACKRLHEAAKSYSIMELELCQLAINIASFSNLLKRDDFDAIIDHLALTNIIKSKAEPAMTRIKGLLELLVFHRKNLCEAKHEMQSVFKFSDADVPPSRGIWWPRTVLCKVILTC